MGAGVELVDRDREARRHLWEGLARMEPAERVAFLRWRCRAAADARESAGLRAGAEVTDHGGTAGEAFHDLLALSFLYGADMGETCEAMERWLRKRRKASPLVVPA